MDRLLTPRMRMLAGVLAAVISMIAAANGGCSSASSPVTPTPTSSVSPSPLPSSSFSPTPPPQNFVSMSYAEDMPSATPTFGTIDGYGKLAAAPTASPPSTAAPTQVIMVTHGQTIAFLNFDNTVHTASLLTPQGGVFPNTFNNVNGASASSPALSNITDAQFSTGNVGTGANGRPSYSKMYNTGSLTGIFLYGDFYDYSKTPSMRGIIIVQ